MAEKNKGEMMKLRITQSAYDLIKKESLACRTETGGLMIGTLKRAIVIRATSAGKHAGLSHTSYTNDKEHDNESIRKIIHEYGGRISVIGRWHKHPGTMSYPSLTDLATARMIKDRHEQEGDNNPDFFVITNVVGKDIKLYCYLLENNNFVQVSTKIVKNESRMIRKALDSEPVCIQPREMDFWDDTGFQFYRTKAGLERLRHEVKELRLHGYKVTVRARDQLCLIISKNTETLLCFPPPEYPLNPPRIYKGNREILYGLPIWNSSIRIIDIINNIIEKRRMHESHCHEKRFRLFAFFRKIIKASKSLWPFKKK
jgi:hypothetical protein